MAGKIARTNEEIWFNYTDPDQITPQTILQLWARWQTTKILGFAVSFKGIRTNDIPIKVELVRQTGGYNDGSAPEYGTWWWDDSAANNNNSSMPAPLAAIRVRQTGTEPPSPATGAVLYSAYVHPQSSVQINFPPGQELMIIPQDDGDAGYGAIGIRITLDSSHDYWNCCTAQINFEE